MKFVNSNTGLMLRLGVLVTAMLLGQQAMAVGTRAGTDINNTVLVDYEVGGFDQTQLSATANFVVDRRVDFELTVPDANLTPVLRGGTDYFVEFQLTNTSNGVLDFSVVLDQIANVAFGANGDIDNVDFTTVDFAVAADPIGGASDVPVRGVNNVWVDELDADQSIRIYVFADADLGLPNDAIAGVSLDLTATEPGNPLGGDQGGALDDTTDTAAGIDNVIVTENLLAEDGFVVEATTPLTATKTYGVVAGDLGSGKPIPGATVEYTITVDNPSTTVDATNVVVVDTFSSAVTLVLDGYDTGAAFSEDIEVVNGASTFRCTAADTDTDNCAVTGTVLTVGGDTAITVAADEALNVTFQVLIPDPATTP